MSGSRENKRKGDPLSSDLKRQRSNDGKTSEATGEKSDFLITVNAFILPASIEKVRLNIFQSQLQKYGGTFSKILNDKITHIIVDDKMEVDRMCRLLKVDDPPESPCIVKSNWLSACFREKRLLNCDEYLLDISKFKPKKEKSLSENKEVTNTEDKDTATLPKVGMMFGHKAKIAQTVTNNDSDSDYQPSDGDGAGNNESDSDLDGATMASSTSPQKNLPRGNWVCAQSSKVQVENCNKHITDKLEEMVRTYESTNDKWRAFGYQKAIQVLKKQPKPISTFEEAKSLPGVGKRLAEKIWEIAESGELRKLNELKQSEDIRVMELFKDVWGAGATTARTWYQQGMRTLEDLRTKANLTYQQKIGLKHYDDFLDRMPRAEAGEIETVVKQAAESILDGVIARACGSYRRGKVTCGDVDILVTHPDGKSHKGLFAKLLAKLKEQVMSKTSHYEVGKYLEKYDKRIDCLRKIFPFQAVKTKMKELL